MDSVDADARKLAKVIEHPIRARIIELLGDRGPLGWKELSTEVGVKTGALYYHLDTLEGLVGRDSAKRYFLTKSGRIVYTKTSESHTIEAVQRAAVEIRQEGAPARRLASFFAPRQLISTLTSDRTTASIVFVAVFGAAAFLSGVAGFSAVFYYVRPDPGLLPTIGGFAASLAVILVLCYGSARFAFKATVEVIPLAAASGLSFIPVLVFSATTLLHPVESFFASYSAGFTLALVFAQGWSSAVLGAGLSVVSGIRIEKTLLVSLVVLYATMAAMLILGVSA